jgi:hypothetical protein
MGKNTILSLQGATKILQQLTYVPAAIPVVPYPLQFEATQMQYTYVIIKRLIC